jgi:hypothetical protein
MPAIVRVATAEERQEFSVNLILMGGGQAMWRPWAITSIEIYHTGHNLIETRAPIRAMSFASWGGRTYLVAAYTCTPVVTIPLVVGSTRSGVTP